MESKNRAVNAGLIFFNCLVFCVFTVFILNSVLFFRCENICRELPCKPVTLMRVHFYGSSENDDMTTVSANISILDSTGTEVAVIERSWNGYFLACDFTTVSFFNKNFYFPQKIYGTDSVTSRHHSLERKSGSKLTPYYLENKKCLLFGAGTSEKEKEDLYALAVFSTSPLSYLMTSFSKKITVNLSRCEAGKTYGLIINEKGSIELTELQF